MFQVGVWGPSWRPGLLRAGGEVEPQKHPPPRTPAGPRGRYHAHLTLGEDTRLWALSAGHAVENCECMS